MTDRIRRVLVEFEQTPGGDVWELEIKSPDVVNSTMIVNMEHVEPPEFDANRDSYILPNAYHKLVVDMHVISFGDKDVDDSLYILRKVKGS